MPVWGIGKVVESQADSIKVGEKLYGYFPMSSEAVLTVGKVSDDSFMEASPHRADLAAVYNNYRRLAGEPEAIQALEDERCLYFPLFITSYVLYDYLTDNDYFGAKQIVIGSVSSKTAFGLAQLLHEDRPDGPRVIGCPPFGRHGRLEVGLLDDNLSFRREVMDESVPVVLLPDPRRVVRVVGDRRHHRGVLSHLGGPGGDSGRHGPVPVAGKSTVKLRPAGKGWVSESSMGKAAASVV